LSIGPLVPIGTVYSPFDAKGDLPRQASLGVGPSGVIELSSAISPIALEDLAEFDHIWVLSWLDRAVGWRPKVAPPRGARKRGVFATRAPHRPNPIGLSCVRLTRIEERRLLIEDHDLLDGTPILDLKPYLAYVDAHPESSFGWTDGTWHRFAIQYNPVIEESLIWLEGQGVDLKSRLESVLSLRPQPRAGHRVSVTPESDLHTWAWRTWRVDYQLDEADREVQIRQIRSGLTPMEDPPGSDPRDARQLHQLFNQRFPPSESRC